MPICTECHARLDYGMQFLLGYEGGASYFLPHRARQKTPIRSAMRSLDPLSPQ